MRTTVRLDDHLLQAAKSHAARTGRTLTSVIEEALRQSLATGTEPDERPAYRAGTFSSSLCPGVDLDDNAALVEVMEG